MSSFYLTKNTLCLHYKSQLFQILHSDISAVYRVNHKENVNTRCNQNEALWQPKKHATQKAITVLQIDKPGGGGLRDPVFRPYRDAKQHTTAVMMDETVSQNTLKTTGHLMRKKPVRLHNSCPNLTLKLTRTLPFTFSKKSFGNFL